MDVALTSFAFGLLATMSPCLLPLYPGFLAYLGAQTGSDPGRLRQALGLFVLAGVMTAMLILGMLIAMLSISIGGALAVLVPVAAIAILVLGVLLLLDRNPFYRLPQIQVPLLRHPPVNAFAYGLLYGPIAMPCAGPFVVAIFAYSLTFGEAASRMWAFVWFGLGFGMPLLAISFLSGMRQRDLTLWFARHGRAFNVVGGLLLIAIAIYALADNWSMLSLYDGGG